MHVFSHERITFTRNHQSARCSLQDILPAWSDTGLAFLWHGSFSNSSLLCLQAVQVSQMLISLQAGHSLPPDKLGFEHFYMLYLLQQNILKALTKHFPAFSFWHNYSLSHKSIRSLQEAGWPTQYSSCVPQCSTIIWVLYCITRQPLCQPPKPVCFSKKIHDV